MMGVSPDSSKLILEFSDATSQQLDIPLPPSGDEEFWNSGGAR